MIEEDEAEEKTAFVFIYPTYHGNNNALLFIPFIRFGMATTQSTQHKETHSRKHLVEDDTMEVSERWDFIQKNSYKMLEITCLRSNSIAHKYRGTWRAKVVYIKHLSFFLSFIFAI